MFNFPNTPSLGDAYQPTGGPVYQWDGEKWMMAGSALIQTPAYDQRNRIVNPAMQISQENGATPGSTAGYCAADQWFGSTNTATGVASFERIASSAFSVPYRLRLRCTTLQASLAATEYSHLYQPIEGIRMADFRWGSPYAKPVVLRFDAYADQAGTYSIQLRDGASSASFVSSFTLAAGVTKTVVVPIPAPAIGTWPTDNTKAALLGFCFAAGSNYRTAIENAWQAGNFLATTGVSNGLSAVNNSLNVWNVGLYLDPQGSALPPAFEMPDEAQEQIACQRYWQNYVYQLALYCGAAGQGMQVIKPLPVIMRVTPAYSVIAAGTVVNGTPDISPFSTGNVVQLLTNTAIGLAAAYNRIYALNSRM